MSRETPPSAVEVLKRAAEIVAASWASGPTNAKDMHGRSIPLFTDTQSETGRARLHPEAHSFSIYGAIVKATGELGVGMPHSAWMVLQELVRTRGHRGGINSYNASEITAEDAASLLSEAATVYGKLPEAPAQEEA